MPKTILKKKKRTDRTLGQMVKAKLTDKITHSSIHIHTHKKRKRGKKNIYIYIVAPKVHLLNIGMLCCPFRYSTDAGYVKLFVEL